MKRRLQIAGLGLGFAIVAAAALWFTSLDASVTSHAVAGVVEKVGPLNMSDTTTNAIESSFGVDVKIDDGRRTHVSVLRSLNPVIGQHVQIIEHVHGSGRSTFSWK